jgi:hypothetical protein
MTESKILFPCGEVGCKDVASTVGGKCAAHTPPQEKSPVVMLDPERLKPLPRDLFDLPCGKCEKPESRWAFLAVEAGPDDDPIAICSKCFLYESGWGANREEEIRAMVKDVETAMGVEFAKDERGFMSNPRDCDRILGAVAYISRMYVIRNAQVAKMAAESQKEDGLLIRSPSGAGKVIKTFDQQFKIKE